MIAGILLVIGGLNWGLVGISGFLGQNWDLVKLLFIDLIKIPLLAWIVYIVVGVSAVLHLSCCIKGCSCEKCEIK